MGCDVVGRDWKRGKGWVGEEWEVLSELMEIMNDLGTGVSSI